MLVSTIIMAVLAIILLSIGYFKGKGQHITGLQESFKLTIEIIPMLIFAFIVAGMVQVLLPREVLSKWVGAESGMRGILLGTLAGALSPGGPYVNFPLVAALMNSGASIGTTVAFLTSWSLLAISRLPMEIGILGWPFVSIRMATTFFFPIIAGLLSQKFFGHVKLSPFL